MNGSGMMLAFTLVLASGILLVDRASSATIPPYQSAFAYCTENVKQSSGTKIREGTNGFRLKMIICLRNYLPGNGSH